MSSYLSSTVEIVEDEKVRQYLQNSKNKSHFQGHQFCAILLTTINNVASTTLFNPVVYNIVQYCLASIRCDIANNIINMYEQCG